jgi:hypothetical protein
MPVVHGWATRYGVRVVQLGCGEWVEWRLDGLWWVAPTGGRLEFRDLRSMGAWGRGLETLDQPRRLPTDPLSGIIHRHQMLNRNLMLKWT